MALIEMLWSLLPIPIGMACLFFAWRIPFQDQIEPSEKSEALQGDEDLEKYFSDTPENLFENQKMEKERQKYFVILFTGLGIGAIILGLSAFHPVLEMVAKGTFLMTLVISTIIHFWDNRTKPTHTNEKNAPESQPRYPK